MISDLPLAQLGNHTNVQISCLQKQELLGLNFLSLSRLYIAIEPAKRSSNAAFTTANASSETGAFAACFKLYEQNALLSKQINASPRA